MTLPPLHDRHRVPEVMDDPDLDPRLHMQALRALARVNSLSAATGRVWAEVRRLVARRPDRPLRVLDIACGGGDVAIGLAARGRRAGIALEVHGCDLSPVALEYARAAARERGDDVRFFRLDALADPLPEGYDLIFTSLFLHHLADEEAVRLLGAMREATRQAILVQDLRRTRLGYALAFLTLRLISRSSVARVDGPRSVAAAFSLDEARGLAREAGLVGARVEPCWPERFLLHWSRA
jgi:SAM-dependent methyltransferase